MKNPLALALAVMLVSACGDTTTSPEMSGPDQPLFSTGATVFPSVTGGGWTEFVPPIKVHVAFTAKLHRDGAVKGQLQYTAPGADSKWHGVIDCLAVDGNRAWFGGVFTSGDDVGESFEMSVIDNGEGGAAPLDERSLLFIGFSSLFTCNDKTNHDMYDWEQGSVQVRGFNFP